MAYFADLSELPRYLDQCFAIWKGTPVRLRQVAVNGRNVLHGFPLGVTTPVAITDIDINSKDFRCADLRAGFCMMKNKLRYLTLTRYSAKLGPDSFNQSGFFSDSKHYTVSILDSNPCLKDCLLGIHPTLTEALKKLNQDSSLEGVSFHRDFAIVKTLRLKDWTVHYKMDRIGVINKTSGNIKLDNTYNKVLIKKKLSAIVEGYAEVE